jgi:hypothetical protein
METLAYTAIFAGIFGLGFALGGYVEFSRSLKKDRRR